MSDNYLDSRYGQGTNLAHFYHASGFAIGAYHPFIEKLSEKLNLSALHLRPTWPNPGRIPRNRSWQLYADDLIAYLDRHCSEPIIGIGHSLGSSTTLMAAMKRPDLFKALVLIESTQVAKLTSQLVQLAPKQLLKHFNPAKNCIAKQDTWKSRADFYAEYRSNRAYKRISDENLKVLAEHAITETDSGVFKLVYDKNWETINYMAPPYIMDMLDQVRLPTVAIRGKPSIFLSEDSWQLWQKKSPEVIFKQDLNYGHLFPLEAPEQCAKLVLDGLSELNLL